MTDTTPAEGTEGRCGRTYPVPKRVTVSSTDRPAPVVPDSADVREDDWWAIRAMAVDLAVDVEAIDADWAEVSVGEQEKYRGLGQLAQGVLAVVGQGVTAEVAFEQGWVAARHHPDTEAPRPAANPYRPAPTTTTEGKSGPVTAADVNVTELVARALCAREGDQWDALDAAEVAYWTGLAHAALAALDSPAVVAGIAGVLLAEQYPAHDPAECSDDWQRDQADRLARAVVDWLAGGGR